MLRARPLLALACVALPATARAETRGERIELAWSAPEECLPEGEVLRRMEGAASGARATSRLRVRARVEREGESARLVLAVGERGERVMVAATCDALVESASVVVAMSVREAAEAAPAPPSRDEAAPAPPRDEAAPAPREGRASLRVRVEGLVDVGTLPAAAPGGGLALGVAGRHLVGEVAFGAYASQRASSDPDPSRGADFAMLTGAARACWSFAAGAVEVAPCLGARLARITGQGVGARRVEEGAGLAGGPEAGIAARIGLGRALAVRASVGLAVPIGAQTFVITSFGTVHAPSAVTAQAAIGPEVTF